MSRDTRTTVNVSLDFDHEKVRISLMILATVALLAAAWWAGALSFLLSVDLAHTWGMFIGLLVVGIVFAYLGNWNQVWWLSEQTPKLGLMGTVYGGLLLIPAYVGAHDETEKTIVIAKLIGCLVSNFWASGANTWLVLLTNVCRRAKVNGRR